MDAMTDHKWIKDIAQNLTNDLLSDFFGLWMKIDAQNLNLDTHDEDQLTSCSCKGSDGQIAGRERYLETLGT